MLYHRQVRQSMIQHRPTFLQKRNRDNPDAIESSYRNSMFGEIRFNFDRPAYNNNLSQNGRQCSGNLSDYLQANYGIDSHDHIN